MSRSASSLVIRLSSFVILAAALAWLSYYVAAPKHETHKTHVTHASQPPTTTNTDATEVFQRAFWKRPTAADKILHAERREWADADGLKKWQWFIAVEPSPELVKRLREENTFNLVPAPSAPLAGDSPEWFSFKPAEVELLKSPLGNLRLFFGKKNAVLYATDTGAGFRAGAPEAPKPVPQTANTGRLPRNSPPNPPPE